MITLQCFLYLLMRDTVVPGEVERLVREAEKGTNHMGVPTYSNSYLSEYAHELSERLCK